MSKSISALILILTVSLLLVTPPAHGDSPDILQISFIDAGQHASVGLYRCDDTDSLIDGGQTRVHISSAGCWNRARFS